MRRRKVRQAGPSGDFFCGSKLGAARDPGARLEIGYDADEHRLIC